MKRDPVHKLALGLGTGAAFGFLLQKGGAAKHHKIVNQLRLDDWDVVKIMSTAALVGGAGAFALRRGGHVERKIKPLQIGGVVSGGVLFGTGMAALGYCPGTSVAAIGEGRRDALAGVLGMMLGALAYVALLPRMKPWIELGDFGEVSVPELAQSAVRPRRRSSDKGQVRQ